MAALGKHGVSTAPTSAGRRAFLAARAQSTPAIEEAKARLDERFRSMSAASKAASPGTFSLLYESGDGRLCLFQLEDGHLSAVDSSRLA